MKYSAPLKWESVAKKFYDKNEKTLMRKEELIKKTEEERVFQYH